MAGVGRRGPEPVPLEILKNRGSWRAKTRAAEESPEFERGRPTLPHEVRHTPFARTTWYRITEWMERAGILRVCHAPILSRICLNMARLKDIDCQLRKGEIQQWFEIRDRAGRIIAVRSHPALRERIELQNAIRNDERSLGLNPSAARCLGLDAAKATEENNTSNTLNKYIDGV